MKRVLDFIERLLYTGMKPGAPQAPVASPKSDPMRWLGPLRGPVDRFLSGGPSPTDPLYLSHRTVKQKVFRVLAVTVPFLAMVTVLFMAAAGKFSTPPPEAKPDAQTALAATLLPNYKDVQLKMNRDIVVVDARLDRHSTPVVLSGTAKNVSDHKVTSADIVFELTDREGSQVGGYSVTLENVASQETRKFTTPIPLPGAAYALVREVVSH